MTQTERKAIKAKVGLPGLATRFGDIPQARRRLARSIMRRVMGRHRRPDLSRRLNAILRNCGRSVIQSKLADLEQRFGIASTEVNPAYSSQTCNFCGYVDARNRRLRSRFQCLWCGHTKHADLNAASNIGQRRTLTIGSVFQRKDAVLAEVCAPAHPRQTNPYFGGAPLAVARSSERREAFVTSRTTPAPAAA